MAKTLGDFVAKNDAALRIVNDLDLSSPEAAHQISTLGFSTSEAAVRRLRSKGDAQQEPKKRQEPRDKVPTGWEPYAEEAGRVGSALVRLPTPGATEKDLLITAGFDPDAWRIKGPVNTRRWMRYDQEWLYYYKFDVEQGESEGAIKAHVDDLVKLIRKRKVPAPKYAHGAPGTYVLIVSDWQIGKSEGGRGSADTIQRWKDCLASARENIVALRKMGVVIDNLAILGLGDLVEGCVGHYDMQTFSVDLDRREQNRAVREMLTDTLLTLVPMFVNTTVAVIGGNHGEHRKKGKAFTTFGDNDDVAGPEAVKEAFDLAGWDMIDWFIPGEELSMRVDLDGVLVGIVHGHQFKGGVNALKKAEDWWRASTFGLEPVHDVQILFSGHFHHYCNVNVTAGRSWIQAPTIDPGSKWHTDSTGVTSVPGVLSLVVTPHHPLGYDHLRVHIPQDTGLTS